ncbi:MAG: hypothetical protein IT365_23955 [Candidatus Hydrogenedentes bacterium]|nr:hypothetical protein [Candidatus Hydrogenedentota bacterium]
MKIRTTISGLTTVGVILLGFGFIHSPRAWAHCDTLSGPVVMDAKKAIEANDVAPVLKWVRPQDENEIRSLFDKTLVARQKGRDVQELVDMHFFETLVRIHRAGEGAPYTGLKPADTPIEPGIEAAEKALEAESDTSLVGALQAELESSVRERFERTVEAKKHKDESVAAGREYVEAYVEYIHYVEHLHEVMSGAAAHGHESEANEHAEAPAAKAIKVHQH